MCITRTVCRTVVLLFVLAIRQVSHEIYIFEKSDHEENKVTSNMVQKNRFCRSMPNGFSGNRVKYRTSMFLKNTNVKDMDLRGTQKERGDERGVEQCDAPVERYWILITQ
jgi:hypothetical protein